jgi:hypothetical protein
VLHSLNWLFNIGSQALECAFPCKFGGLEDFASFRQKIRAIIFVFLVVHELLLL